MNLKKGWDKPGTRQKTVIIKWRKYAPNLSGCDGICCAQFIPQMHFWIQVGAGQAAPKLNPPSGEASAFVGVDGCFGASFLLA